MESFLIKGFQKPKAHRKGRKGDAKGRKKSESTGWCFTRWKSSRPATIFAPEHVPLFLFFFAYLCVPFCVLCGELLFLVLVGSGTKKRDFALAKPRNRTRGDIN